MPANPRLIRDEKFNKLKKSIEEDPEMLNLREIIAYDNGDKKLVIIMGNMRYRAMLDLGMKEAPVKILPNGTTIEKLKAYTMKDNTSYGEWDWDMLANEWDLSDLDAWGVDMPEFKSCDYSSPETEKQEGEDEYERMKKEFEERMASGELSEDSEEYQEFLSKFEAKKTTDDCYTPQLVYDAVADWVAKRYGVNKAKFVRPFYPGGDYQNYKYPAGSIVVDNPPFSIMSEIVRFYHSRGIRFFLFGPALTIFSSSSFCTTLCTGVTITYENGAKVNTSFLTNLEDASIQFKSEPTLYKAVDDANTENLKTTKKELPKYSYDKHVISAPMLTAFSKYGIDFIVPKSECEFIRSLDAQKTTGNGIYGSGFLISDRLKAEREKAEREKAEREKAEREKAEREKAERWELSEREYAIIERLNRNGKR